MAYSTDTAKQYPGHIEFVSERHFGPGPEFLPAPRPTRHWEDWQWYQARREHAWRLRRDGLRWSAIGKRMDTSGTTIKRYVMHLVRARKRELKEAYNTSDDFSNGIPGLYFWIEDEYGQEKKTLAFAPELFAGPTA